MKKVLLHTEIYLINKYGNILFVQAARFEFLSRMTEDLNKIHYTSVIGNGFIKSKNNGFTYGINVINIYL